LASLQRSACISSRLHARTPLLFCFDMGNRFSSFEQTL
jgi:hypothetical protein